MSEDDHSRRQLEDLQLRVKEKISPNFVIQSAFKYFYAEAEIINHLLDGH
jgi:hypothetical protein